MCNRYVEPKAADIERYWQLKPKDAWPRGAVFPRKPGAFIRTNTVKRGTALECERGRWGLIPVFAKTAEFPYATNNARFEEITTKASYKTPWAKGQRCIIPAESFDEPCWETGKNVWWTFRRADGEPWNLAGLWNRWVDLSTGEVFESYTMLTLNADHHPFMRRMHKPDPKLPPDAQDKRSVVVIEREDIDRWLTGSIDEARTLVKLAPEKVFDAAPA